MSRLPRIEQELRRILADVSGIGADELHADAPFVDQGLDSLSLTQATLELERVFGLKLRFRRLLEDLDTLQRLGAFLDAQLAPEVMAPPAAAPTATMPAVASVPDAPAMAVALPAALPAASGDFLQQLVAQQMQLMSQQLALLGGRPVQPLAQPAPPVALPPVLPAAAATTMPIASASPAATAATVAPAAADESAAPLSSRALVDKPFGASARITLEKRGEFTPAQRHWLDDFIARYNARTGKSKTLQPAAPQG